jgi:hypothetical protein
VQTAAAAILKIIAAVRPPYVATTLNQVDASLMQAVKPGGRHPDRARNANWNSRTIPDSPC